MRIISAHIQFIYKTYKKTDVFISEDVPYLEDIHIEKKIYQAVLAKKLKPSLGGVAVPELFTWWISGEKNH